MKTLNDMSITELKSLAYDHIQKLNDIQNNLSIITNRIEVLEKAENTNQDLEKTKKK